MGSSGQRKPSGIDLQHSVAVGSCIWEWVPRGDGGTPPMSATSVKGLDLKTGLKVILFPKTGNTGGEACRCWHRRLKEQLEKEEGSMKRWDHGSDEK